MHIHDWHVTILHLLGFDHERLTFRHASREMRLTEVSGTVANAIFA
jgi:ssRNA-specific RNase YbeY (16S rRNA maturation enzyme)